MEFVQSLQYSLADRPPHLRPYMVVACLNEVDGLLFTLGGENLVIKALRLTIQYRSAPMLLAVLLDVPSFVAGLVGRFGFAWRRFIASPATPERTQWGQESTKLGQNSRTRPKTAFGQLSQILA